MIRTILNILMVIVVGILPAQVRKGLRIPQNASVGLSLEGGGAKGFAHIGVLKVIDSLGIKVDYISGTSMGAIIGGLYASGYSANDLEKIVKITDFYSLIANEKARRETTFFNKVNDRYLVTFPIERGKLNFIPKSISSGQSNFLFLKELLGSSAKITNFSKLKIPFLCVATNLESGKMKIFEKGDLTSAIMASSAYPTLMDPVKVGDSLYIDGAMTMNYPSQPLKNKGIDVVIGVDLNIPLAKKEELTSAVRILDQIIDFSIKKEHQKQYQYTDINIRPNLKGYTATSYDDKDSILKSGYQEALRYVDVFRELPKKDLLIPSRVEEFFQINDIQLINNKLFNEYFVKGKVRLKFPARLSYHDIRMLIDRLYATGYYKLINYDIVSQDDGYILKLIVEEDNTKYAIKMGLHYDNVFKSGLLFNFTAKQLGFNSILSANGIVGDRPRYFINYFIDNGYLPGVGLTAVGTALELKDDDRNIYEKWKWFRNEVYVHSIFRDRYIIGGGVSHDFYQRKIGFGGYHKGRHFVNPYAFLKGDNRDDRDFPTMGLYLFSEVKLLDVLNEEIRRKSFLLKGNLQMNFPISSIVTYRLNLFGGFTIGGAYLQYYKYHLGGIFEQDLGSFLPFRGYQFGSYAVENVLIARNEMQFKMKKNLYLNAHFDMLNTFQQSVTFKELLNINDVSAGISVGYKSPIGQIQADLSRSFDRQKMIFSVIVGHWF